MGVAPRPLLNVADRRGFADASMHRSQPALPLRGGALVTNQRPPQRDGSLLRVLAVPDPSARSRVGGRGRRSRCPPVAPPNPIASTTPLIGRRQRLSRRRRRRATAIVDDRPSPGMPPRCHRASIPFRVVTRRRARARAGVPTTRGRTGRVRRRPARASPLPLLTGADRGGSAAPSTHRCEPSHPLRGGVLVSNQRPPKRVGSLPRVPAVPVTSARSWVGGRGQRRRCPPVAPPNAIASTTPLIGRCQRLSRRCRRRAVIAVGVGVPDGSSSLSQRPPLCLALASLSASSLSRVARY